LREAVTCREGGKKSDREESIDGFHRDGAFRFVALKEARPENRDPVGASDIGTTRADSYVKTETRGRGSAASILKETLKNGNVERSQGEVTSGERMERNPFQIFPMSVFQRFNMMPTQVQMEVAVPILEHGSVRGGESFDQ
jgi:hypothetical protein